MKKLFLFSVATLASISISYTTASAQGTHFLAEGGFGIMQGFSPGGDADIGRATNLMFGVGGRPGGSWLRYYFVIEGLNGNYVRTHEQNFRTVEVDRSMNELGVGLRVIAPITPHIRWVLDLEGVVVFSSTEFQGVYTYALESSEVDGGLRFGTGLHYRPFELLSIGGRFAMTAAFDHFDTEGGRDWLVGFESEYGHFEVGLSLTLHF